MLWCLFTPPIIASTGAEEADKDKERKWMAHELRGLKREMRALYAERAQRDASERQVRTCAAGHAAVR